MMMILLAKGRLCRLLSRFFSSASASASAAQSPGFDAAHYLVSTFGFSSDKAAKVSRYMAHLKSPENPDSVLRFLKDHGFSEAEINKLITSRPELLRSSPEKTLGPNLRALRDMGLSASALNQIILAGPQALHNQTIVPRIRFWMNFFDHDEPALVTTFKRNLGLVGHDINTLVSPKISLLQSYGLTTHDIQRIITFVPRAITSKFTLLEDALKRTEELGFRPGSGMFPQGLRAMVSNTKDALQKKMILLMSFGWSEEEFLSALRKAPGFVEISEKNLQAKMEFFIGEAMCDLSCIVSHPLILKFSLEKRLRPRNNVLQHLESKGLSANWQNFYYVMMYTDKQFVDKYILPHKEEIWGLHEAYLAACA